MNPIRISICAVFQHAKKKKTQNSEKIKRKGKNPKKKPRKYNEENEKNEKNQHTKQQHDQVCLTFDMVY